MSPHLLNLLLFVWMAFLFGGFLLFPYNPQTNRRMPTWTRMASSFVLVVAAWGWNSITAQNQTTWFWGITFEGGPNPIQIYGQFIAIGMTLGFIGDLLMARLIIKNDKYVIGGIAAFGLGHIAYILAMLFWFSPPGMSRNDVYIAVIIWWLIATVGWYVVVFRAAKERSILLYAALAYALLLATTAGMATGIWLRYSEFLPLAVGAALFLLSDLLLAAELFSGLKFKMIGDVVWLLYGPAQALIVYSIGVTLMLSPGALDPMFMGG